MTDRMTDRMTRGRFNPRHIQKDARSASRAQRAARAPAGARVQAGEVGNRAFARRDNNKRYII